MSPAAPRRLKYGPASGAPEMSGPRRIQEMS
jgi:hypothetical protein